MELYKSKYTSMPENSYFDRRMANGEKLADIFDDTDYLSKVYNIDKNRPIQVRIGEQYNYVANNYLLFDNWFVLGQEFDEYGKCTYAYRRYNEQGIREGGVLIRRDGSYVTREEFLDIVFGGFNGPGQYAIVKQYDGLLNIVDVEKGIKLEKTGIKADCVAFADYNFIDSGFFAVATGNLKGLHDLNWITAVMGHEIAREKALKCNIYIANKGIISPSLWFDYVEPFRMYRNGNGITISNHAIVHLNGKRNYIDHSGNLLSEIWFDIAGELYRNNCWIGEAGVLKSEGLNGLDDYDDNYNINPDKYTIYRIDRFGGIKKI